MLNRLQTLTTALVLLVLTATAQADDDGQARNRFAHDVAGSYVIAAYLGGEGALPVQAMATLSADGGVIATDTDDYGFDIAQDFHGPKHGSWERTDRQQLTLSIYEFGYGVTGAKGYTPMLVFKLTFVVDFSDETLSGGTGRVTYQAHLLPTLDSSADPLDLESGFVVAAGEGAVEFARLPL
jgi:hypothetical protein